MTNAITAHPHPYLEVSSTRNQTTIWSDLLNSSATVPETRQPFGVTLKSSAIYQCTQTHTVCYPLQMKASTHVKFISSCLDIYLLILVIHASLCCLLLDDHNCLSVDFAVCTYLGLCIWQQLDYGQVQLSEIISPSHNVHLKLLATFNQQINHHMQLLIVSKTSMHHNDVCPFKYLIF